MRRHAASESSHEQRHREMGPPKEASRKPQRRARKPGKLAAKVVEEEPDAKAL